jgi:hypothetical protein
MTTEPTAFRSLAALKPFQRATVEYVFERLHGPDSVDRFLVADEVGLGKTLVARGVIAKTIDQSAQAASTDIVYICSNADIGKQNLPKLHPGGLAVTEFVPRINLLPTRAPTQPGAINFVAFTPGTSFSFGDQFGHRDERLVLYRMLRVAWDAGSVDAPGAIRILCGDAGFTAFNRDAVWWALRPGDIDRAMLAGFERGLANHRCEEHRRPNSLRAEFLILARELQSDADISRLRPRRARIVGEIRRVLAHSCIDALRPSLVILDEFQRYRSILVLPENPTVDQELAHSLFVQLGEGSKTLLLSATPYRMYTLSDESDSGDHYADFIRTMEYLLGAEGAALLREDLRAYRDALLAIDSLTHDELKAARDRLTTRLRSVMCRTERLAIDDERAGMLGDAKTPAATVTASDLRAYLALDAVSHQLRAAGDAIEYWKSTPYALSFMESYDVRRRLEAGRAKLPAATLAVLRRGDGLLRNKDLKAFRPIDAGNPRLRALATDLLGGRPTQPAWIPPSLPYYRLRDDFAIAEADGLTKRLIFSAWTAVPQAVASVLSYEVEREMLGLHHTLEDLAKGAHKARTLLTFRTVDGRAASMASFLLLYPSPGLARLVDPLLLGRGDRSAVRVEALAKAKVSEALRKVLPTEVVRQEERTNPAWYWAAALLIDMAIAPEATRSFFSQGVTEAARSWIPANETPEGPPDTPRSSGPRQDSGDETRGLGAHFATAADLLNGKFPTGRRPRDLAAVLARTAIAGPGVCALRALGRALPGADRESVRLLRAAARVAWGFRSTYRQPDVAAMIRGDARDDAYWRSVLDYNIAGCLQAVLDEYVHVVPDVMGRLAGDSTPLALAEAIAQTIYSALTIRTVRYSFADLTLKNWHDERRKPTVGARYALRFGVDATDETKQVQRAGQVREAFNSPFWPFVLATTSVGQEGLDFHLYCHRVVHWNLPANPVDLEQREGRVHRYKGHALRRNVANRYRAVALSGTDDPWRRMFEAAAQTDEAIASQGIVPYWVLTGPYKIERDVPSLPFSREIDRYQRLRESRAVYRQVLGQGTQEDFIEYLIRLESSGASGLSTAELHARMALLRLNLSPLGLTHSPSPRVGATADGSDAMMSDGTRGPVEIQRPDTSIREVE